jgi:2-polyprenyl-3-methyl-5-hydroxy-6-metoxy-1,4-benzoquinol methylase
MQYSMSLNFRAKTRIDPMPQLPARIRALAQMTRSLGQSELVREQCAFVLNELRRINEEARYRALRAAGIEADDVQTRASFDWQWNEFSAGVAMPNDEAFMRTVRERLCGMTGFPASWFAGKRVADVGCGAGRWSYGLLELGAQVTSFDQSEWALKRTAELCRPHAARHATQRINLLDWDAAGAFDLVFCFGVVHHTGNTYQAIANVARKAAPGGRVFLMVYGFPETLEDFKELNHYEDLRREMRLLDFPQRKQLLIERFGEHLAHGYFDAVSPRVNDLLTFEEIAELLGRLGLRGARRTVSNRNHHVIADRPGA